MNLAAWLAGLVCFALAAIVAAPALSLIVWGLKAGLFVACVYIPVALVRRAIKRK